ncbi:hypothetical protein ACWDV4_15940 [Micromonospora sp. NPDC003197]
MAETTEAINAESAGDAAWAVWEGVAELRELVVAVPQDGSGDRSAVLHRAAEAVRRAAEVVNRVRTQTEGVGSQLPECDPTVVTAMVQWQVGVGCLDLLTARLMHGVVTMSAYPEPPGGNLRPMRRSQVVRGLRQQPIPPTDQRYAGAVVADRLVGPVRHHPGPQPCRYDQRVTVVGHDRLLDGYAELVAAAFQLAVERRFGADRSTVSVLRFVAGVRAHYDPYGGELDLAATTALVRAAINPAEQAEHVKQAEPESLDLRPTQVVALRTLLLIELLMAERLDRAALAGFFATAIETGAGRC